ncbi:MAG: cyclase dehydrase [Microvirga sp.]
MRYETERTGRRGHPDSTTDALARGLGVFSIALGLMEVAAPRALARFLGMEGSEALIRGYGLREIATGVGILASNDPTPWIWGRVAGDALDIGTLAGGLALGRGRERGNAGLAIAAVAGVTLLDVLCGRALAARKTSERKRLARDYGDRRGMPQPAEAMRGAARDFEVPRDFRIPDPLRPWTSAA